MERRTWTRTFAAVALALAAITGVAAASGHPGSLDTGFGHRGTATLGAGTRLFGVAVQRDGKIVAAGESGVVKNTRLLLARFNPSGSLDRSFGRGGLVQGPPVHSGGSSGSLARAVAVLPDGKIVVVGKATSSDGSGRDGLLVERL